MSTPTATQHKRSLFDRFLDAVEKAGNRLPHPVTLFLIFIGLVMVASVLAAAMGIDAVHPGTGKRIEARNLFSGDLIQKLLVEMPKTFAAFPPLGQVLAVMLGIGVADKTGLIAAALKAFMGAIPGSLLTAALIFAGIMSSLAVDAGFVVVIPLGAVLFAGAGRHPLVGLAAAFAGVSGGFSSNLLLTGLDPLLAAFSTPAAQLIDPGYEVAPTANYYLMVALVPVFVVAGTWITERVVEPRMGAWKQEPTQGSTPPSENPNELTDLERRGLRWAAAVLVVTLTGIALLVIPAGAPLRGPEGELGPFFHSIVSLMMFVFLAPGLAFGIATRKIRRDSDAVAMTAETMSDLGIYIVLAFVAAHFIALFTWSNLGTIVAIRGAEGLKAVGFTGLPLLVAFVLVSGTVNLIIGSASAKWAILAPIFVPMLMLVGISPELTQGAYRLGDSFTNMITPLMPYFPLVIVFGQKYVKDLGIGTLIGAMLPYSIAFGLASTILLVAWVLLGLPLGPGIPLEYAVH